MNLKKRWFALLTSFTSDSLVIDEFWSVLHQKYNEPHRAYHNLNHIQAMLILLDKSQTKWEDVNVLELAIWYHDSVYDTSKKDNELQSALLAKKHLTRIGIANERMEQVYTQIVATQKHSLDDSTLNTDTPYLLDFDLEILGRDWESYQLYTQQIREEYRQYPRLLYNYGRRKAMKNFLKRPFIYQTSLFRAEKEQLARNNIERELEQLSFL